VSEPRGSGEIITFYSYKGGTGRSMALANVACLLAAQQTEGNGVLMVDWDLEAPGLHRFFQGKLRQSVTSSKKLSDEAPGLIDLFVKLDATTPQEVPETEEEKTAVAMRSLEALRLDEYVLPTTIPHLSLIKAGSFDAKYSTRVNSFHWENLFQRSPLLFPLFAERLAQQYRYVLIDSRTGLTDISGICTMLMPQKVVVVFTPNRQSLTGVIDLVRRATQYRRQSDDLRPLLVFPLPSRIETSEPKRRETWRFGSGEDGIEGYQPLFEKLFTEAYALQKCDLTAYLDDIQVPHTPPYSYGEDIAALIERGGDVLSLVRIYGNFVARLIQSHGPWQEDLVGPTHADLAKIKSELAQSKREAETQASRYTASRRRTMLWAAVGFVILVGAFFLYRTFVLVPQEAVSQAFLDLSRLNVTSDFSSSGEVTYHFPRAANDDTLAKAIADMEAIENKYSSIRIGIDLSGTGVENLEPLRRLANMWRLDVSNTRVSDLSPLVGLTKLTKLNVTNAAVKELGPIQGVKGLEIVGWPSSSRSGESTK